MTSYVPLFPKLNTSSITLQFRLPPEKIQNFENEKSIQGTDKSAAEPDSVESQNEELNNFESMKVSELKTLLRSYGLPVSGSKKLLIKRLDKVH